MRDGLFIGKNRRNRETSNHADHHTGDDDGGQGNRHDTANDDPLQDMVFQVFLFLGSLSQQGDNLHADLVVQRIPGVGTHGKRHDQTAGDPPASCPGEC